METTKDIIKRPPTTETFRTFRRYLSDWQAYCGYTDCHSGFGNCLYADLRQKTFVVSLYSTDRRDPRVAYLTVSGTRAEWRYGSKAMGFARCPIVTDPALIRRFENLFDECLYKYFQHPLFFEKLESEVLS